MKCPRCVVGKSVKSGFVRGRQRHKCKLCGYHYSVPNRQVYDDATKERVIRMVADGAGFRQTGRAFGISQVTVMRWVRKYGEQILQEQRLTQQKQEQYAEVIEVDELCGFYAQKKTLHGCGY